MSDQSLRDALENLVESWRDTSSTALHNAADDLQDFVLDKHPAEPVEPATAACESRWHLVGPTRAQPVCLACYPAEPVPVGHFHGETWVSYPRNACSVAACVEAEHPAEPVGVSDEAVEAGMERMAAWVFADDARADFDWSGLDEDDKADALDAMRVALEAAAPLMGATPRPALDREVLLHALPTWLTAMQARSVADTLMASGAVRPLPTREQIAEALHKAMDHPNSEHCPITETGWHQCGYIDQCNGLADAVLALMGGAGDG